MLQRFDTPTLTRLQIQTATPGMNASGGRCPASAKLRWSNPNVFLQVAIHQNSQSFNSDPVSFMGSARCRKRPASPPCGQPRAVCLGQKTGLPACARACVCNTCRAGIGVRMGVALSKKTRQLCSPPALLLLCASSPILSRKMWQSYRRSMYAWMKTPPSTLREL